MKTRFLTQKDMSAAKHEQEVINSMAKRGEINLKDVARSSHIVCGCGCGAEGCVFINHTRLSEWQKTQPGFYY